MKRTPFVVKPYEESPQLRRAKASVRRRSGGRCEVRSPVCSGVADQAHHRLRRSQGGKDTPDNLLDACTLCHRFIHHHPELAYDMGWLTHSWEGR